MVTGPWLSSLIARGFSTWPAGAGSRSFIARSWPTPTRRCRRTRSSGAGRTRSCSRASSAATSGRRTASSACARARWCARAARRSRCCSRDGARLPRHRAGRRPSEPLRFVDDYLAQADARGAARAAALLRRRGRLAGLRHRPQLRAAARARSPTTSACPSSASRSPTRSWCSTTCAAPSRWSRRSTSATGGGRPGARLRRRLRAHRGGAGPAGAAGAAAAPARPDAGRRRRPRRTRPSRREAYEAGVRRIQEYILAGDAFQVVYSQRFQVPRGDVDPFDVYRALRVINPSPYMFHLEFPEAVVTGASPEVLVRLDGGEVEVRPIAGHAPARRHRRGGRRARGRAAQRSQGAGRAHDADRPRPQRRRARVGARHGPADRADDRSSATRTSCT